MLQNYNKISLYLLSKEGEFHTLFGRLDDNRQKCFKYFKMGILIYENFRVVAHRQSKEEYTYIGRKKRCKITASTQLLSVCKPGTCFGYIYSHPPPG